MSENQESQPTPTPAPKPPDQLDARRRYWRANLKVIFSLLAIWAIVSYGCSILFIEQLNKVTIGTVKLGFWFAQQGSIYVFVVLIFVYAWIMDRMDRKYQVNE